MTEALVRLGLLALVGLLALCIAASAVSAAVKGATLPRCEEDAVVIGIGQFQDGQWDAYTCGPAVDDFEEQS